jgi:hypothetical protein
VPMLEGMGYEHRDDGGVRDRIFLVKGPWFRRTHNRKAPQIGASEELPEKDSNLH